MNREIDERVFWCKTHGDEIKPYQLPPVGRGLPKGAIDFPLIYPVIYTISVSDVRNIVRAICAIPKRREYVVYSAKISLIAFGKRLCKELLSDYIQCLRETFFNYVEHGYLSYTETQVVARELRSMIGFTDYNQKRIKTLLKLIGEA